MISAIVTAILVMSKLLVIVATYLEKYQERQARTQYLQNRAILSYEQMHNIYYSETDVSIHDIKCVVDQLAKYINVDPGKLRPSDDLCDLRFAGPQSILLSGDINDVEYYLEDVLDTNHMSMREDLKIDAISINDLIYMKIGKRNLAPHANVCAICGSGSSAMQ